MPVGLCRTFFSVSQAEIVCALVHSLLTLTLRTWHTAQDFGLPGIDPSHFMNSLRIRLWGSDPVGDW